MKEKFAAQLYTLRNELKQDFPGVLRELKHRGWDAVQISGLHGYAPEDIAEVLDETGLRTAGMHVSLDRMSDDLDAVLKEAAQFHTRDLIVPFLSPEMRNEPGYRSLRRRLHDLARRLKPLGYRISYHNHAFEFETEIDGRSALEYLLSADADSGVLAEIDVYWVKKGGRDPLSFIRPYARRMPIIHLKDMDEEGAFAEVGAGQIEFTPILAWGERNGIEWYAVEQDVCKRNPLDCLQTSLENLCRMVGEPDKT